jgi:hypothetical protein
VVFGMGMAVPLTEAKACSPVPMCWVDRLSVLRKNPDPETPAARQMKDWIVDVGDFDQLDLVGVGSL